MPKKANFSEKQQKYENFMRSSHGISYIFFIWEFQSKEYIFLFLKWAYIFSGHIQFTFYGVKCRGRCDKMTISYINRPSREIYYKTRIRRSKNSILGNIFLKYLYFEGLLLVSHEVTCILYLQGGGDRFDHSVA